MLPSSHRSSVWSLPFRSFYQNILFISLTLLKKAVRTVSLQGFYYDRVKEIGGFGSNSNAPSIFEMCLVRISPTATAVQIQVVRSLQVNPRVLLRNTLQLLAPQSCQFQRTRSSSRFTRYFATAVDSASLNKESRKIDVSQFSSVQ
jgi:hypothetical protein